MRTGGDRRNREYAGPHVESAADAALEALAYDPQTAGGLLVSLPAERGGRARGDVRLGAAFSLCAIGHGRGRRRGRACASGHRGSHASAPSRPVGVPAARARLVVCALPRRHLGRVRAPDRLRASAARTGRSCGDKPYPEQGFHAFVEFGNRMVALVGLALTLVTWLGLARVVGLPRGARLAALGAFLVTVAQIPHGRDHDRRRPPPAGGDDALPARAGRARARGRRRARGLEPRAGARTCRRGRAGCGSSSPGRDSRLCAALVVTGAVATASGPHPGADEDVSGSGSRSPTPCTSTCASPPAFGIGVLFIGWFLWRLRDRYPGLFSALGRPPRRSRRAGDPRRGAVPDRAAVGARARARLPRGGDLGAQRGRSRTRSGGRLRCSLDSTRSKLRRWRKSSGSTSARRSSVRS